MRFRILPLIILLGNVAFADDVTRIHDTATWLGFSKKYQQFSVRRQLSFRLTSSGPFDPKTALRPGFIEFKRGDKGLDTLTCADFCKQRGFGCSAGGQGFGHSVGLTAPSGQWESYVTRDCAEPLVKSAMAKFNQRFLRGGACWCDQPGHVFEDLSGLEIPVDLVEVYAADGTLKRSFLEDATQAPTLARLRADLGTAPVEPPVLDLLRRELLAGEKWRAHAADGDFQLGTPTAKHPGGKCTVELEIVDNQECIDHEGSECIGVEVALRTPAGRQSVLTTRTSTRAVTFEAHWVPTPIPLLVGVLHWKDANGEERLSQHDELVLATGIKGCTR